MSNNDSLSALVVREPFASMIVDGKKSWELRSRITHRRGLIGIVSQGCGRVIGTVEILDVLPEQSIDQLSASWNKHGLSSEQISSPEMRRWRTPWVLGNARRLEVPVSYKHAKGAVVWVTLSEQERIAVMSQLRAGASGEARREVPIRARAQVAEAQEDSQPHGFSAGSADNRAQTSEQFEELVADQEALQAEDARWRDQSSLLVPVAKDGSWFGPHLERGGVFQIGEKGSEIRIAGYENALRRLQAMPKARWRRPNSNNNWGIVTAVSWEPSANLRG